MGHCWVGSVAFSNLGVNNLGMPWSFSQEKIMKMECELLISNLKDPKTIALVKEKIGHISDGSSPHCAGALNLGLEMAFELKKKNKKEGTLPRYPDYDHEEKEESVLLRCPNSDCARHQNPVSCSLVRSNTFCVGCRRVCYMQCTGCGHNRTSSNTSCQMCRKRFFR